MAAQQRVELFSGRVKKVKPADVSKQRYDFLKLSEAEPDLGVPETTDSSDVRRILLTDKDGNRYWSDSIQIDNNGDLQSTGQMQADAFHTERLQVTDTGLSARFSNEDINLQTNGNLQTTGLVRFDSAMGVKIGNPDAGALVSRAVTMTTATPVSRGMAQMNFILGKLVPKPPPDFPKLANGNKQPFTILAVNSYRMCDFSQTNNTTTGSKNVSGGVTVSVVLRTSLYESTSITACGPGNTGTVAVYKNSVISGSRTMTDDLINADNELGANYLIGTDNNTYGDLIISNDRDHSLIAVPAIAALFWQSFDAKARGTVTEGWNEVYINHTAAGFTDTALWYYDASTPGAPQVTSPVLTPPVTPTVIYSSTIPHYTTANNFTLTFNVNRLSGDMYPTSDTFITGTAGGAFNAPISMTYASAGVITPLARNLYVASGSLAVTTTAGIKTGFGSSNSTCSISVNNSYTAPTSQTFSPGAIVLYKTSNSTAIDEGNISVAAIGSGSGNAQRIVNPGSTDTPTFSASATAFDSQNGPLESYDAVVVGSGNQGVLKHDTTNYSTGYLPTTSVNLSNGRTGAQYFTFKFIRQAISKFNISITGSIAGLWVALPGSTIATNNGLNGWLRMDQAYAGSGIPGTGTGGNGSNGCSLGGVVTLNSSVTQSRTCTFGTVSSSNTATNEIYIRIRLNSGQSVTALSIVGATN